VSPDEPAPGTPGPPDPPEAPEAGDAPEPPEVAEIEALEPEEIAALPETLPVLPLKETVVFPEAVAPLAIGEPRSIRLIDEVMNRPERLLALVVSRDPEAAEPPPEKLHEIGTAAVVQRMVRVPDGTVRILVQGVRRVRIGPYTQTEPFLEARVEEVPDRAERTTEVEALARNLQGIFTRIIQLVPHLPDELQVAVANLDDPTTLSYLVSSSLRLSVEERQELLEEADLEARLRRLTVLVNRELELLELGAKIQSDVQTDL
jgi:ATP-dependent Lon protease